MAGAQGSCLQRGQDAYRPPRRRLRLPRIQRPPLPSQAADQAVQAAVTRLRKRLAAETRTLRGGNAMAIIARLNPVIRGWTAYYRPVVSSGSSAHWTPIRGVSLYKWARWRHPNKPVRWVVTRYFGKFSKFRNDHWVFGDRDSSAHLVKFSWTRIERHIPVKGAASPDDPALPGYWAERRKKVRPPLDAYNLRLLSRQDGQCPLCGDLLLLVRRAAAPVSRRMGAVVAARHPQGDSRQLPRPPRVATPAAR